MVLFHYTRRKNGNWSDLSFCFGDIPDLPRLNGRPTGASTLEPTHLKKQSIAQQKNEYYIEIICISFS